MEYKLRDKLCTLPYQIKSYCLTTDEIYDCTIVLCIMQIVILLFLVYRIYRESTQKCGIGDAYFLWKNLQALGITFEIPKPIYLIHIDT